MKTESINTKWGTVEVRGMDGADYRFYQQCVWAQELDKLNQGMLDRCVKGKLPKLAETEPGELDLVFDTIERLTNWPKPTVDEDGDPKN